MSSALHALQYLATALRKIGVDPAGVEIVMHEPDVERVRADLGKPSMVQTNRSLQRIGGFIVMGTAEAAPQMDVGEFAE